MYCDTVCVFVSILMDLFDKLSEEGELSRAILLKR
jgi:hypothetical protein